MSKFLTSRERIERAEDHRDAIGVAWGEFIDEPDSYEIGVHVDEAGLGEIWVQPTRPLPSIISLELGEMLYQLRAALDAMVYQAAIHETKQDPPPNEASLEFPICWKEKAFKSSESKIAPISDQKLRGFLRKVQPFYIPQLGAPGAEWLPETLGMLNDWARKDRHRRLHVVGSWASEADPHLHLPDGVALRSMNVVGLGALLTDQNQLATFELDGWRRGLPIEANPDVFIDLASDEAPAARETSDTFDMRTQQLIAAVRFVLRAFEDTY